MVCYGGGHVKVIEPVYRALCEKYHVTVFALTNARHYLAQKNIPFLSFLNFEYLMDARAELLAEDALKSMFVKQEDKDESFAYMGLNLRQLEQDYGVVEANAMFKNYGRSCFFPTIVINELFDCVRPDLVVTTNSPRAERAALFIAKERGIPSICIADNLWLRGGILEVAKGNLASKICVLNRAMKKQLFEESGYNPSDIVVTGTPIFDQVKVLKEQWTALASTRTKKVILLADCELPASSPNYPGVLADPNFGSEVRATLDEFAQRENVSVIFRPHPSQTSRYANYPNVEVSESREDLHKLLLGVDVVVTAISTVGLEAACMGLSVISLEGTVYRAAGSYAKLGIATGVNNAAELTKELKGLLESVNQTYVDLYDGSAVSNISRLCGSLL